MNLTGQMVRQKQKPFRCEKYRRHVAGQPCRACGRHGRSNAAHIGTYGRGIKNHDYYCIALCTSDPGRLGCHQLFDARQKAFSEQCLGRKIDTLKAEARAAYEEWKA